MLARKAYKKPKFMTSRAGQTQVITFSAHLASLSAGKVQLIVPVSVLPTSAEIPDIASVSVYHLFPFKRVASPGLYGCSYMDGSWTRAMAECDYEGWSM